MIVLELYITRHGQSYGQTEIDGVPMHRVPTNRRPPGCETNLLENDWRLTPLGEKQAALLGESLADTPFDTIFCSPLERARATAMAIEARQPRPVPVHFMRDLTEIGDYGPETPEQFHARALRVAAAIREQSPVGARVMIAAHASFNNLLLGAFLGVPMWENLFRFGQDNTGLSRIIFASEDVPQWKRVRLYCANDLSHLPPELRKETVAGNMKGLYA